MPLLRTARRTAIRALPADRRVKGLGGAHGRAWVQARKLVAPFLQRPVTLTTASGLHLRLTADPVDEHIAEYLLGARRREYFPPWPSSLAQPACILDIGAHHGLYAAAALAEYPNASVICVEPSQAALGALRANLGINGYTARERVVQAALAPHVGRRRVAPHRRRNVGGIVVRGRNAHAAFRDDSVGNLGQRSRGARPDIVKCNAEGAEYTLLDQLEACNLRPSFLLVMMHPDFGDPDHLVAQATALGYAVTHLGTEERPVVHLWRLPDAKGSSHGYDA